MSAPKAIYVGMRGEIICHVQTEPSVNTELEYRLVGTCEWHTELDCGPTGNEIYDLYHSKCGHQKYQSGVPLGGFCSCGDKIRVVS